MRDIGYQVRLLNRGFQNEARKAATEVTILTLKQNGQPIKLVRIIQSD